jgi:hypothetical protein
MDSLFIVIAAVFVVAVLAVAGFALFELTPFARHRDHYRDESGNRRFESPRLD